jgi:hypothetical protein
MTSGPQGTYPVGGPFAGPAIGQEEGLYASVAMTVKGDLVKVIDEGRLPPVDDLDIMSYVPVGFLETASLLKNIDNSYTPDKPLDAIAWIQQWNLSGTGAVKSTRKQ